jgi:signal transduction histidine kinase
VCGDRDKIRQVLLNLLSNAAKFTPRDGAVRLDVRSGGADRVAFVVTDTGPGIPADRTDAIFEPFVQLRAQYGASNEGTGLGLAISRDLARGMKGDITVAPGDGGGSVFTFLLPAGDAGG